MDRWGVMDELTFDAFSMCQSYFMNTVFQLQLTFTWLCAGNCTD